MCLGYGCRCADPATSSLRLPRVSRRATLATAGDSRAATASEENSMRKWQLIIGVLALLMGLLWIGQGTGYIAWPQSSFMISQIQWAYYGAALAVVGLILIWQGKR
jgi:hypothetical protein